MSLGFNADKFWSEVGGAVGVLKGDLIYNPLDRTYVPRRMTSPGDSPAVPTPDMTTVKGRLEYVNMLFSEGLIDADDADAARARISSEI